MCAWSLSPWPADQRYRPHDRRLPDYQLARSRTWVSLVVNNLPLFLATTPLVMLVWGVASEALRDIITGFLNEIRFE